MKPLIIALSALAASCAAADGRNCYARPPEFMDSRDWWKGLPPPAQLPEKNVIRLDRSGVVTWNGADLSTQHGSLPTLDMYLELVGQFNPQPLTVFEWEKGASCYMIEEVRKRMIKHLQCDGSRTCLEGPDPY